MSKYSRRSIAIGWLAHAACDLQEDWPFAVLLGDLSINRRDVRLTTADLY
jgi:hypothetical protein